MSQDYEKKAISSLDLANNYALGTYEFQHVTLQAQVYATLAQAQAIREQNELLRRVVDGNALAVHAYTEAAL